MIRHKRRRSRLEVSSVRTSDSGEYTCTASNVISPHRASASVQVTVREMVLETRHSPWNRPSENEQTNNGGILNEIIMEATTLWISLNVNDIDLRSSG